MWKSYKIVVYSKNYLKNGKYIIWIRDKNIWFIWLTLSNSYDFIKCVNNIEIKNSKIEKERVTDPHVVWLREQFYVCITEYSFA